MEVDNKVENMRLEHDEALKRLREDSNTRKKKIELDNEIEVSEKAAELIKQETKIDQEKLQVNHIIKEMQTNFEAQETMETQKGQQEVTDARANWDLQKTSEYTKLDLLYDDKTLN